jgi:mediator of RNA polymerase II transcription subunit 12, fungi type
MAELSPAMSPEHRAQIRTLLPYVNPNPVVVDLFQLADSSSQDSIPVQNRPWEWIEHIGEPSPLEPTPDDSQTRTRHLVKNSASLSLDLFGSRATGDGILNGGTGMNARVEANLRSFEDSLSSESIFRRDWRETRREAGHIRSGPRGEEADEVGALPAFAKRTRTTGSRSSSRRTSPASSVHSRGSFHPSGSGSLRPSPVPNSTPRANQGTKRKQAAEVTVVDDDSDIEIIDDPAPVTSAHAAKKPRNKPAPAKSTRGKRR